MKGNNLWHPLQPIPQDKLVSNSGTPYEQLSLAMWGVWGGLPDPTST